MDASPTSADDLSLAASDLALPVDTFALGWQGALTRSPKFDTTAFDFSSAAPKAIALNSDELQNMVTMGALAPLHIV